MNYMSKKDTLRYLKNSYCRFAPSKLHGVGVFAIRDIPKGVDMFKGQINQRWYRFKTSELKNLDSAILKMVKDFFVTEQDNYIYIPATGLNSMDISFYLNHSKQPNVITNDDGFTFISKRKIKKGEELTTNYHIYDPIYR